MNKNDIFCDVQCSQVNECLVGREFLVEPDPTAKFAEHISGPTTSFESTMTSSFKLGTDILNKLGRENW